MAELKNSEFLDLIIENAKKYHSGNSKSMTAEKFILSLIDILSSRSIPGGCESEQISITAKLKEKHIDFEKLHALLEKSAASDSFMGPIYFQSRMMDASKQASSQDKNVLSADGVLDVILNNPNDSIKNAIACSVREISAETAKEESAVSVEEREPKKSPRENNGSESSKSKLTELTSKANEIHRFLANSVYGQDKALSVFTTGYFQAEMLSLTDKERKRPRATFLFAGPPGVGKTLLAEKAAEVLKLPFKRFDMSEYCDKEAAVEFIGSDNVYKNSERGNFTGFVADNPKSLILFDEIEKAHISIIHMFLQILDAGRIRDSKTDEEISLVDTIMIFTTNAGRQIYEGSETGDFSGVSRNVILKALQNEKNPTTGEPFFPAAICSRFASGNVVMFNCMKAHSLRKIAEKEILRHAANLENQTGIKVSVEDDVFTSLLFAEGGSVDARTIRSRAEAFFNDEIFELFRLINSSKVPTKIEDLKHISIGVELPSDNNDILSLFKKNETQKGLVFSSEQKASLCADFCPEIDFVSARETDKALRLIDESDIKFILVDMSVGVRNPGSYLNAEDIDSVARDFLHAVTEKHNDIPVYILQYEGNELSEEEQRSFLKQGVRDFVSLSDSSFAQTITVIAEGIHQQMAVTSLAKANKLIAFETWQAISEDGQSANIKLFDFKMTTAIDAEDAENILSSLSKPNVHFDDVIGAKDAKEELKYFVEYLKNPKKFTSTGVSAPKGLILYGPPGTGKTMLAKAMACESDVTFITAEGNQFLKQYVGEGAEKVHELFRTARKYAPSILFIDEIDAIATERRGAGGNGSSESDKTLTAFLAEMDGFKNNVSKPVFVLAATNFDVEPGREKSLDPALMRRFDRRVLIDLPRKDERLKYIEKKLSSNKAFCISDEKKDNITLRSTGMSIAELESIFELALRTAIRSGNTKVTDDVLDEAFETFCSGEKKSWDASQLERVARHESGHAFLCWLGGETPSYLTVVARGDHGGYMRHADNEGKAIYTKEDLLARIQTSLGGRAAEMVYYGDVDGISTGPSGDLASATYHARNIVCRYGMDTEMGLSVITEDDMRCGEIAAQVRAAVNKILSEEMQKALKNIEENKECIDALVEALLKKNQLTGSEIDELLTKVYKGERK